MKKVLFFLITITSFIFLPNFAYAKTYHFYGAEFLDGIYLKRHDSSTNTTYYQTAQVYREKGNNNVAYCLEPFIGINSSSSYSSTYYPENLSETQRKNISALAHYGYGYANHTDVKWIAITQVLIWKEANPNDDFYFTDYLDGNRIDRFTDEINELNALVAKSYLKPSFDEQTFEVVKGKDLVITDTNNLLDLYSSPVDYAKISNNTLTITDLNEGYHQISFNRKDNTYRTPVVFFQSADSQDLLETGNLDYTFFKIYIYVDSNKITFNKIDKDTKSTKTTGEAELNGAVYELLNANKEKIMTLNLKNNTAYVENIDYGTYYLRETKAGKGYTVNKNLIMFKVNRNSRFQTIKLENEVIKSKLVIYKEYGEDSTFTPEANIKFNIYNSKKELIKTLTTNELGYAEIILPYGKYYLEQVNTTEGYEKVEPISFEVKDGKTITYKLKNYKIKVPDTKSTSFFDALISFLIEILC